ncbi:biotinidase, partial [Caerostris extrusa]
GADVIVFPEYGIFAPASRNELKEYLETIPDPKKTRVNPCDEPEIYSQRRILYTLSCLAKEHSIVLVANMGDIQNCQEHPQCPEDGVFQFNTNVVFDRDGTLLVRYRKERLFFELGMDLAREQQNSTFKTDFGTFATYICFDIDYERMSEVARWPTVDAIMFFCHVFEQIAADDHSPVFGKLGLLGNNATLMVSNIQMPGYLAMGSGIFHGEKGALSYTFNPDGFSKLVVSRVPKSDLSPMPLNASITAFSKDDTWEWEEDGKDIPLQCSRKLLNRTTDVYRDYCCMEENITFTLAKLEKDYGNVEACHNGFCCTLNYNTSGLNDQFYLGVFSGTYNHFNRYFWCEEDCVLARCDPLGSNPLCNVPDKNNDDFPACVPESQIYKRSCLSICIGKWR